ncbi:PadR family transcriptional regulator [Nostocoides australiense]|uniref:Putative transcriptional regulator PadR-like family protein n=1 Tax=Nostocoides australiense Ben110 TaxID=1193182 RepID=W6K296_9MICO|nr:PadR family transcriptional regulator [Tetrasphaera australiensis]MCA0292777.1 PadR family transcriptional regulator [Actinomycetota bacterium]CCH75241.1 putative transcriptional regulator PadR-like family protein [Tetrasphaera australiensis Ben110]HPF81964.1 PadR family transcriptional regulator [Tetrasphaera australiensis]HRW00890.1 PadR family transcriptional regulator [Tetrasphaera sp.]
MAPRRQHLLDLAVLGLLHEAPMHGYELRKRLNLALGPFRALSFGTLYPALRGLVADGLISESNPVSAPNPVSASNPATGHAPATPASRRPRIVYELTDAGRTRFAELNNRADDTAYDDDGFEVRIAFFARTESAVRLRILEGRRARLEDRLAALRTAPATPSAGDIWSRALTRHSEDTLERDLRWLGELIAAERSAPARPGTLTDPSHPAFTPRQTNQK